MDDLDALFADLPNAAAAGAAPGQALSAEDQLFADLPQASMFAAANPAAPLDPTMKAALEAKAANVQGRDSILGKIDSVVRGAADIITLGYADELAAAGDALFNPIFGTGKDGASFSERYGKNVGAERTTDKLDEEYRPGYRLAGQVAGALPTALIPAAAAARGASLGEKVVRGVVAGGAQGAAYGSGSAEEGGRGEGALEGAKVGAAVGAVIPAAGHAIGKAIGKRVGGKAVPTVDELKERAGKLYDDAKREGVVITNRSFASMVGKIKGVVGGYRSEITPKAAAAIDALEQAKGLTPTLDEVDMLRQIVGQAAKSTDPNERRIAGIVMEHVDDWLGNLQPKDVWAGNPKRASELITEARDLWKRQAKGAVIERAIANAENAASGVENGLRGEFRSLLKNPKHRWTPEEYNAIQKVVKGDVGTNLLRFLGMFGYSTDQARNFLGPLIGGGLGSVGGPVGAVGLPVAGTVAKAAAKARTGAAADRASATVRNAGQKPFDAATAAIADARAVGGMDALGRGVSVPYLLELTRSGKVPANVAGR